MKSKTAEVFALYAKDYDKWFKSPEGQVLFPIEVKAVRLVIKKNIKPPFLEVGVGTGAFALALGIPFGIDPALNALCIAKMKGIAVALAQGEELPFRDNTFGAIFILFTLCFVENSLKVLEEAKRVLRPEGKVVLGIINKESGWGKLYSTKKKEGHPVYSHANFFTCSEILKLLDKVNLRIIKCSSTLLQPPSENPYYETPKDLLIPEAGFICFSASK